MVRGLSHRPTLLRATPARGLARNSRVDREAGDFEAGLITGVAVVTRGEALGHDLWLDEEFIAQVSRALREAGKLGVKSRFTHPGLSSDGLGKSLGRLTTSLFPEKSTEIVRGDLHISQSSHKSPEGDLGGYVMDMAEEDPQSFGMSIVFERDVEAEEAFMRKNGGEGEDEDYWATLSGFASPDKDNVKGLRHARLKHLRTSDAVDSPAANPNGIFHRGDEIAFEVTELLQYVLRLTDDLPLSAEEIGVDVHPARLRAFVDKFMAARGLSLVPTRSGQPKPAVLNSVVPSSEGLAMNQERARLAAENQRLREQERLAAERQRKFRRFALGNGGLADFAESIRFRKPEPARLT